MSNQTHIKGVKMEGKKFWLGMLVLTLVFGMTFLGCDNGTNDGGEKQLGGDDVLQK